MNGFSLNKKIVSPGRQRLRGEHRTKSKTVGGLDGVYESSSDLRDPVISSHRDDERAGRFLEGRVRPLENPVPCVCLYFIQLRFCLYMVFFFFFVRFPNMEKEPPLSQLLIDKQKSRLHL